ncbi:IgA FC receptor precursor [Streptomyces sp. ADI98-12]|nr:IgA FC receptor precursor [Streptomyces sp. ADI98-12]SUP36875.1 secreted protein [Streptomyces griseus]
MRSGAVGIYGRHPLGWRTLRKVKGREQPMRQVMRKGLITVAAATGVIAVTGGYAQADAGAGSAATNSPGVLSGNSVSVPVHVPVNVCGNSVDVVGVLNPAFGNGCANVGGEQHTTGAEQRAVQPAEESSTRSGGAGDAPSGATAEAVAAGSPGILSGNVVQAPVDVPVNVCGNSVSVVGLLNPAFGNNCANAAPEPQKPPVTPENPEEPGEPEKPPVTPEKPEEPPATPEKPHKPPVTPEAPEELAETGNSVPVGLGGAAAAGLLLGGAILYRKARQAA